jgi:hypothetical protein
VMNSTPKEGRSHPNPRRVRLPGFTAENDIGLGEVVKRAAAIAGAKPCSSCEKRAQVLNSWVVFGR